ncbi:DUF2759 family protein [Bacillus sp. 03113]|uniref:DUF2759 family protein n=1 Tax=Bacillus sp. 03113 TaxID=2578211 RepID=UPI00114158E8|nr:DUF2759 family protein [Bacillus sp. 03113]
MGTVIIFAFVTILAAFATIRALKDRNILGIIFGFGAFVVFGFFSVMTLIAQGYPASL